jgi:hypothetical protein
VDPEAILNLKPVDGQDPFFKRLTVRGGVDLKLLFNEEAAATETFALSNSLMAQKSMAEARTTIRNANKTVRSSVFIEDFSDPNPLSSSLNAYANEIEDSQYLNDSSDFDSE